MTHTLSSRPATRPWSSRIPAGALAAGRFVLHFGEMVLAMWVGMLVYMPLAGFFPAVLRGIGMVLFMAAPMVAWMRIRGHGWRHGFEMAASMLVPWAAMAGVVALGAANVLPWLAQASDPAMYLGMFGFMLVRRDHYAGVAHQHALTHGVSKQATRVPWRRLFVVIAYLSAILLVPFVVATLNYGNKLIGGIEPIPAPTYSGPLPALPTPDPSKKIAVVVSGPHGSEIGDTLEAYEILARSGVFNVYSVAPERTALSLGPGPMTGASGLDFLPHFSFAEYDAHIGRQPDLIAIPAIPGAQPGFDPESSAPMIAWIRDHFGSNTVLLGICSGNTILADTGLAAGHKATSNTGTFSYVESHSPTTTWLHNLRYVDDGNIITSSNLTSGIDATLHVVDRFAGRAKALDVARQIGFTHTGTLDNPRFEPTTDSVLQIGINAGLEWPQKQQLGVLLYEGVTELGLSGLVDPLEGSASARTYVMGPERRIVQSRNGFLFLPRYDFNTVPALDRVVVPAGENVDAKQQVIAAWSAIQSSRPAEDIYRNVGPDTSAYDVSFEDLARTRNAFIGRTIANVLFYSTDSQFPNAAWPVAEVLAAPTLSLLGAASVYGASHLRFSRQARLGPTSQPA